MITGIGTDICSVDRVKTIEKKHGKAFLTKFLSNEEIIMSSGKDYYSFIAGRFAAKEALQKAVSSSTINASVVTIINDKNGRPIIKDQKKFLLSAGLPETSEIHISISHEKNFAVATVIIER